MRLGRQPQREQLEIVDVEDHDHLANPLRFVSGVDPRCRRHLKLAINRELLHCSCGADHEPAKHTPSTFEFEAEEEEADRESAVAEAEKHAVSIDIG